MTFSLHSFLRSSCSFSSGVSTLGTGFVFNLSMSSFNSLICLCRVCSSLREGGFRPSEETSHWPLTSHVSPWDNKEPEGEIDLKRIVMVMRATRMAGRSREFSGERSITTERDGPGERRGGSRCSYGKGLLAMAQPPGDPWLVGGPSQCDWICTYIFMNVGKLNFRSNFNEYTSCQHHITHRKLKRDDHAQQNLKDTPTSKRNSDYYS